MEVSSEIYRELNIDEKESGAKSVISTFAYKDPDSTRQVSISIELCLQTSLDLVGHQVWRGSLLLSDFLIANRNDFACIGKRVLELGSGCGLAAIVAAINRRHVTCSDLQPVLNVISSNLSRNRHLVPSQFSNVKVTEIDFLRPLNDAIIDNFDTVISADVIYDNEITEGLINNILRPIFEKKPQTTIYLALEKRYVFTIEECDAVAPCYEHFCCLLKDIDGIRMQEMPLTFPQFFSYNRVKELLILKITCSDDLKNI